LRECEAGAAQRPRRIGVEARDDDAVRDAVATNGDTQEFSRAAS